MIRLTTDQFIAHAKDVHGELYDYTNTVYTSNANRLNIKCHIHGEYSQLPSNHLRQRGCPKCGRLSGNIKKTSTTEQFIAKSNKKHNHKYDYTEVEYTTNKCTVTIICPEHGSFRQQAYVHLSGSGCSPCVKYGGIDTQEFIRRANIVHNTKYNYNNVSYHNEKIKVSIGCPIHGEFIQRPSVHLAGSGCTECGKLVSATSSLLSQHQFIYNAVVIHGDKYDYTNLTYLGVSHNVDIICHTHGKFTQLASNHLLGHGCKMCANDAHVGWYDYNRLTTDPDIIGKQGRCYLVKFTGSDEIFYKVGITTQHKRFYNTVSNVYTVTEICEVETSLLNAFILEQNILYVHTDDKYCPITHFGGHTECLTLSHEQLTDLISLFHNASLHNITPIFDTTNP